MQHPGIGIYGSIAPLDPILPPRRPRGIPDNIVAFGGRKIWPRTTKQGDIILDKYAPLGFRSIAPASPASPGVSRQVRRYLTREFEKDRKPLHRNIRQVIAARRAEAAL